MRRILLSVGFLTLLIPIVLLTLYNVTIPIFIESIGMSRGTIQIQGSHTVSMGLNNSLGGKGLRIAIQSGKLIAPPDIFVFPLPPRKLLDEYGVASLELRIWACNSTIKVYKVPMNNILKLSKILNISELQVSNASNIFQYISRHLWLYDVLLEKNPMLENNSHLLNEIFSNIVKNLSPFEIAEGRNRLSVVISDTGRSDLCLVYVSNTGGVKIAMGLHVRVVKHLDMGICKISIAVGALILVAGILSLYEMGRRLRKVLG